MHSALAPLLTSSDLAQPGVVGSISFPGSPLPLRLSPRRVRSFASHRLGACEARSAAPRRTADAVRRRWGNGWLRSCCRSSCFVSTSRGAAASYRIKGSGGSPRATMAAGAVQVSTAPVEKPLPLPLEERKKLGVPRAKAGMKHLKHQKKINLQKWPFFFLPIHSPREML